MSVDLEDEESFLRVCKNILAVLTVVKPTRLHPAKTQISLGSWFPPSPIRVFAVRMKKSLVFSYLLSARGGFWTVRDVQADLSH